MTDFIITFRETLEAALVIGIVLSYLSRTDKKSWYTGVYWGIGFGIILSIGVSFAFDSLLGGFEGQLEYLYEGVVMILAAILISWMILWMLKQRHSIKSTLHKKIDKHVETENKLGIFILVFIAVLREGIETVLFLKASALQGDGNSVIAAILGIFCAIALGYLLFSGLKKIPLKKFFTVTTIILILFAAGLFAHGIHELQEAKIVPLVIEEVWDLNPRETIEGVYPAWHEKGSIGGIFKHVLGWNGNPSLLEVLGYLLYIILMFSLMRHFDQKSIIHTESKKSGNS